MKTNFNTLSDKEQLKRKLTLKAITDYFGMKIPEEQFARILKVLRGGKAELTEEERHAVFCIKTNLTDKIYQEGLSGMESAHATF